MQWERVNEYLLDKIYQIFALPGFTGDHTLGQWLGGVPHWHIRNIVPAPQTHTLNDSNLEDNDDEENEVQVGGLLDFIGSLTLAL